MTSAGLGNVKKPLLAAIRNPAVSNREFRRICNKTCNIRGNALDKDGQKIFFKGLKGACSIENPAILQMILDKSPLTCELIAGKKPRKDDILRIPAHSILPLIQVSNCNHKVLQWFSKFTQDLRQNKGWDDADFIKLMGTLGGMSKLDSINTENFLADLTGYCSPDSPTKSVFDNLADLYKEDGLNDRLLEDILTQRRGVFGLLKWGGGIKDVDSLNAFLKEKLKKKAR